MAKKSVNQENIAATNSALNTHKSSSDHDGQYYTETEVNALLAIGTANSKWIACTYHDYTNATRDVRIAIGYWSGLTANDTFVEFLLPVPLTLGSLTLRIKGLRYYINDADANDYIDSTLIYAYDNTFTQTTILNDGTNRTAQAAVSFTNTDWAVSGTDFDTTGQSYVVVVFKIILSTANELDVNYPQLQYYYA